MRRMVVDCHVHIGEKPSQSAERLIWDMDRHGIKKAWVMAWGASNEEIARAVKTYPDRLVGFATVANPIDWLHAPRELRIAVKKLGLRGLKLHPACQFFQLSDPSCFQLIRECLDLKIPILFHSNTIPSDWSDFSYALPEHITALKRAFPDVVTILGHMGGVRFLDAMMLANYPNTYIEISYALPMIVDIYGLRVAEKVLRWAKIERVVFGTDWCGSPVERSVLPSGYAHDKLDDVIGWHLDLINRMKFTEEEKDLILHQNAERLLHEIS